MIRLSSNRNDRISPFTKGQIFDNLSLSKRSDFMVTLLRDILQEFYEKMKQRNQLIQRDMVLPSVHHKIKTVIGMRRTGKTSFLLQTVQEMLSGHPDLLMRILYLNFEDERLLPLTAVKLGQLLDAFYTLYPENHEQHCYFILDEIQNVPQWEMVVRRFFDTKKIDIFLTGSSAKLLSKEIATALRGRSIAIVMWPFSFKEYLIAKKIALPKKPFGKISKDHFLKHLHAYMKEGGFPETIGLDTLDRNRILQEYVDVVIFHDVVERYKITNTHLIKYLIKTLIGQSGSLFSVHKLFCDLKSQGISVSKMTLHDYLSYIEDTYLLATVPLYTQSIRKMQTNPRKIYAIDTGLVHAYIGGIAENAGHLFENLVYIELRRREFDVYYYLTQERYEVDFLVIDHHRKLYLYQVVWDASDIKTMQRETRALEAAERELKVKGKIITPSVFLDRMFLN